MMAMSTCFAAEMAHDHADGDAVFAADIGDTCYFIIIFFAAEIGGSFYLIIIDHHSSSSPSSP